MIEILNLRFKREKLKKKSFALILTIIFILIFSSFSAMILSFATDSTILTSRVFLYYQAKLLSKSATEIAILMIQNRKPTDPPLEKLVINNEDFNVTMHFFYIGKDFSTPHRPIFENSFPDTNGTIIIDIFIESVIENSPVKFHHRTIQKP
jgi:hypothetical protein